MSKQRLNKIKELIKELVDDGYLFEPRENEFRGLGRNDTIQIKISGDLEE